MSAAGERRILDEIDQPSRVKEIAHRVALMLDEMVDEDEESVFTDIINRDDLPNAVEKLAIIEATLADGTDLTIHIEER